MSAAVTRENHEDHQSRIQARKTNSPKIQKDYVNQVSEEIEGRVTKKLSQEFSKTESCVLGALSRLDEFFQSPQARAHSGPVPETSRKLRKENQGTNEDHSQNDPHPEMRVSMSQSSQD